MTPVRDEVHRLFDRLVEVLAGRSPGQLERPLAVSDIYERLVPYRMHRASLRLDSHEDYEMALLRLLAGEHGLVEIADPAARDALGNEMRAVNPNPGAYRGYASAMVRLDPEAVRAVLDVHDAYAPPAAPDAVPAESPDPAARITGAARFRRPEAQPSLFEPEPSRQASDTQCPHCDQPLPTGRTVLFCPHCGGNVRLRECAACGTQLESGWTFCVTCGMKNG